MEGKTYSEVLDEVRVACAEFRQSLVLADNDDPESLAVGLAHRDHAVLWCISIIFLFWKADQCEMSD